MDYQTSVVSIVLILISVFIYIDKVSKNNPGKTQSEIVHENYGPLGLAIGGVIFITYQYYHNNVSDANVSSFGNIDQLMKTDFYTPE